MSGPTTRLGLSDPFALLPTDHDQAILVGRVHDPAEDGPAVVAVRGDQLVDLTHLAPTVSDLLDRPDLLDVAIDLAQVPEFNARVYAIARAIPPGETLTYGEIAVRLGDKLLARDVGAALGRNPWPMVVPCHRVTAAGGKLGGFSARGGVDTKVRLLTIECAAVGPPRPPRAASPQADLFA